MTRTQLEAVIDALVEIADGWNGAAEDEDRGRSHDALCLTLFDDGSGRLGRRCSAWNAAQVEDWHSFNNLDELISILDEEGVVMEEHQS